MAESRPISGQDARAILLVDPDNFELRDFKLVTSVRELGDGRLVVADLRAGQVVVLDWQTRKITAVGRVGGGRDEYRGVGFLHPLAGDSTLLTDPIARHWYVVHERGVVHRHDARVPMISAFGPLLSGTDSIGHVLSVGAFDRSGTRVSREVADSLHLLYGRRGSAQVDTLATLRGMGSQPSTIRGGRGALISHGPLAAEEQALLFPDGWIAVARLDPYRVDWRAPDGRWKRGAPLVVDRIPVDNRMKCAALNQPRDFCNHRGVSDWPEVLPPFLPPARAGDPLAGTMTLFAAPAGNLLIARTRNSELPGNRYDLVNRENARIGMLTLPSQEAVVGFGARHVYTIVQEQAAVQRLRRYIWP